MRYNECISKSQIVQIVCSLNSHPKGQPMPTSGQKERYAKHRNMKLRMLQYILQLKDLVS